MIWGTTIFGNTHAIPLLLSTATKPPSRAAKTLKTPLQFVCFFDEKTLPRNPQKYRPPKKLFRNISYNFPKPRNIVDGKNPAPLRMPHMFFFVYQYQDLFFRYPKWCRICFFPWYRYRQLTNFSKKIPPLTAADLAVPLHDLSLRWIAPESKKV